MALCTHYSNNVIFSPTMDVVEGKLGRFQHICSTRLHQSAMNDADDLMSLFTSIRKDIAEENTPKTSPVPKLLNKPCFFETCEYAVKERKTGPYSDLNVNQTR